MASSCYFFSFEQQCSQVTILVAVSLHILIFHTLQIVCRTLDSLPEGFRRHQFQTLCIHYGNQPADYRTPCCLSVLAVFYFSIRLLRYNLLVHSISQPTSTQVAV